jgi:hypothetical protein
MPKMHHQWLKNIEIHQVVDKAFEPFTERFSLAARVTGRVTRGVVSCPLPECRRAGHSEGEVGGSACGPCRRSGEGCDPVGWPTDRFNHNGPGNEGAERGGTPGRPEGDGSSGPL